MRKSLLITALVLMATAPVAAQQGGTVEIGLVGKWSHMDPSFTTSGGPVNLWGASLRVGLFLSPSWELELDDAQTFGHVENFFKGYARTNLNYYPHHLRLDYNRKLGSGSVTWMLGAGPAYNGYGEHVDGVPGFKGNDWGIAALSGFRGRLNRTLAFRVDAIVDYIGSPNNGKTEIVNQFAGITAITPPTKNVNLGVQMGLSFFVGHGR